MLLQQHQCKEFLFPNVSCKKAAIILSFYYDSVINILPRVLIAEVEQELVYSDFAHKWGKDYFHYSKEYYLSLIKSILTLIKEDATGGIK